MPPNSNHYREVVLAQDFGSLHSKLALAFWAADNHPQISRVPFNGRLDDPEYPDDINHEYEFIAGAAVDEDGELVEGRQALDQDVCIPLKTMLLHLADTRRHDQVKRSPFGKELLEAIDDGTLSAANQLTIIIVILTYLNYLLGNFNRHIDCYLDLVKPIWGPVVRYRITSEGQAAALYICVPLHSNVRGAGGSYTANNQVQRIIKSVLQRVRGKGGTVKRGNLAKYLLDFNSQKRDRGFNYDNYVQQRRDLTLRANNGPQLRIDLSHEQIQKIFGAAFDEGIAAVRAEARRPLSENTDLAVLFCGGSYLSPGLRSEVESVMQDVREEASHDRARVTYRFLGSFERIWLTAVYVGATLGMLTTPPLASLLPGLTIGMQRRQKAPHTKDRWSGWPTGEVLFSAGHRARHLNDYFISPASDPPLGLGFDLIADPTYHDGRGEEEVAALSAIQITPPQAR
ncbi:hypothetical protein UCDDA912_g09170 [Diaporthe ampelina]|uniref:Actin-like ATPase domain-containing protein n=1 Tax=Diaporthe ampelina TaxID=1214573 RepID=A0A0G2F863_9PEZI|nr:hypothetical protein UCDDA912_g09170 [Diaporthe ampelina]